MTTPLSDEFRAAAQRSRAAARSLRTLTADEKNRALAVIAEQLDRDGEQIAAANAEDLARAQQQGTAAGLLDRLTLTQDRLDEIVEAIAVVRDLPDPIGEVIRGYRLPNGLSVEQIRVPMGVVGMIYEARPNVTVDAATLCLKSGNAALLRGSASAANTNAALVATMRRALMSESMSADSIQLVPGTGHETVDELIGARGLVDVVIPRGGAELINRVVTGASVPVIETGVGNCHIYVDAAANLDQAVAIVVNAKTQRPSVCNAAETLLVHRAVSDEFLAKVSVALADHDVTLHADEEATAAVAGSGVEAVPVTDADWAAEYYSFDLAVGVVDSVDQAINHIQRWSSGHTEAILSDSATTVQHFLAAVDSAAIAVNASTRFTDGGELGFGAEIGISTQKLHARGPMALPELTTTTFVITGNGHIRS